MMGWFACLALAAWWCVPTARGQDDPRVLARAEVGWNNVVPVGRWTPIRVWLDGSAAGATQGMLIVEFQQDKTQKAQIVVPVSTTPGKVTPVDLAAAIPQDAITVEVVYQSGRREERITFVAPPTDGTAPISMKPEERSIAAYFGNTRGLLLHAGVGSIDRSFPKPGSVTRIPSFGGNEISNIYQPRGEELAALRWHQLAATDVRIEDLVAIHRAYEGVEALVLDAPKASGMDPRVKAAIVRWVEGGGRLVLLTTDDSPAWRSWLPIGPAGDVVEAGNPGKMATPSDAAAALTTEEMVIKAEGGTPRDPNAPWNWTPPTVTYKSEPPSPVSVRAEVAGRTFALTERGRREGWTLGWETGAGGEKRRGAIATGPMGLGIVTLVGVDPETVADGLDASATKRAWRSALRPALGHYLSSPMRHGDPGAVEATSALNSIITVPELDNSVFFTIVACLGMLALLLGPIDWFVLKRFRARQRSWLVALGWIGAASVAAYLIPPMLRSGPPQLNRLVIVDAVQGVADASGGGGTGTRAWQQGLMGIFASGPLRIRPDDGLDPTRGDGLLAGTWWRGVSPVDDSDAIQFGPQRRRQINVFGPLTTPQVTSAARERQNVPIEFTMPSWSYRTLTDSSEPARMPIRARAAWDGERVNVELSGTPEEVVSVSVRTARERVAVAGSTASVRVTLPEGTKLAPEKSVTQRGSGIFAWDGPAGFGETKGRESGTVGSHWAGTLEEPARRTAAIEARVASGAWALVEVVLPTPLPASRFLGEAESSRMEFSESHLTVVRLLCPIDPPLTGADAGGVAKDKKEPGA
jgi:hypothetical protein